MGEIIVLKKKDAKEQTKKLDRMTGMGWLHFPPIISKKKDAKEQMEELDRMADMANYDIVLERQREKFVQKRKKKRKKKQDQAIEAIKRSLVSIIEEVEKTESFIWLGFFKIPDILTPKSTLKLFRILHRDFKIKFDDSEGYGWRFRKSYKKKHVKTAHRFRLKLRSKKK